MAKFGKDAALATLKRLEKYKNEIKKQAKNAGLKPSIVAAIVSRETAALPLYCTPPNQGGALGDAGHGHGPMQIDDRSFPEWCEQWKDGKLTFEDGIKQGCIVLNQKLKAIKRLIPTLEPEKHLQAAIASYNCGEGNVRKAVKNGKDLDNYTAHKNYSVDVLARAEVFEANGFDDAEKEDLSD